MYRQSPFILRVVGACALLVLVGGLAAAQSAPAPVTVLNTLQLADGNIQDLAVPAVPGLPFTVDMVLEGASRTIVMQPHSVRSDSFQLLVQGADGELRETAPAPSATYQGHVVGYPESIVAGSLVEGQFSATILLAPSTPTWGVQPLSSVTPGANRSTHVVFNSRDQLSIDARCGTPTLPSTSIGGFGLPPTGAATTDADKVCEIACDADMEFYNKNGSSVANTQNDIENVINAVEAIYQSQIGILYSITTIIVRTSEPDPYSSTNAGTLLDQFRAHWNSSQGSVQRDIAHLFTGKNINGGIIGIAWLNVICNKSLGYGLSESRFTSNFTFRTALTAHELGHNWSAGHCDGQGTCKIMCSGLGGCGSVTTFGTSAVNAITNKKNSSNCLSDPGPPPMPTLSGVSPSSVTAFEPAPVTLSGTGLSAVTQVDLGTQGLGAGEFTIISDSSIAFTPPTPTSLGSVSITVTNASGTSNATTLTYTETDPPRITSNMFPGTGLPHTWSYGGRANDMGYLLIATNQQTFTFQGHNILLNYILLQARPLDALGLDSMTLTIPASALGMQFWSQLVTFDVGIQGASSIPMSWILF